MQLMSVTRNTETVTHTVREQNELEENRMCTLEASRIIDTQIGT